MSTCTRVRDEFSLAFEGELEPAARVVFERHLADCPACALLDRQFRASVTAVQRLPRPHLSEVGQARLRRALRDARRDAVRDAMAGRPSWRWRGAAAAALLVMAGYAVGARLGGPEPVPVVQALPNPDPVVRLRDARNGGWIDLDHLAQQLDRDGRGVQVQPRLRVQAELAEARLNRERQRVVEALRDRGVAPEQVQFVEPVSVDDNLLNGPEVELWVHDMPQAVPAAAVLR